MQKAELIIIFFLSFLLLVFSFYPLYYRDKITPDNREYVGTTYFTADYSGYVSSIEQGIKGRLLHIDKYTTEKLPATLLYYPYLLAGLTASFLGLNSLVAYQLLRLTLAVFYLLSVYWLIFIIFPGSKKSDLLKRICAFGLSLFSSSFVVVDRGILAVPKLSLMQAETQVVNRFVIQPHFLLGNIALVLGLIFLIKYLEKPRFWYLILSSLVVFLTVVFRPSHVLLFLLVVILYFAFSRSRKLLIFLAVNSLFALPGLLYLFLLKNNFPQLPYFQYDSSVMSGFGFWDWILLQGPVFLTALPIIFLKPKKEERLLICFIIVNLILIFIVPELVKLNPLRYLQTPIFMVLSVLATSVIFRYLKNFYYVLSAVLIILVISFFSAWLDFRHELNLYRDAFYIWPPKTYASALKFLDKNTKPDDVVLTSSSLANLVPMISGNTVFWGHTNETLNYDQKWQQVTAFYKGQMDANEESKFVKNNGIKYIMYADEEKSLGSFNYANLKKIYSNKDVDIYQTINNDKSL